jgi:hypothetical protein
VSYSRFNDRELATPLPHPGPLLLLLLLLVVVVVATAPTQSLLLSFGLERLLLLL